MPYILKNYRRLVDLGVFIDYTHTADLPDFKQLNLVYGFNGSGKTTLSRVIRSIEGGTFSPRLPTGGKFAVEFTDGALSTNDTLNGAASKTVVVFNEDFVDENLRWRDGTASPVYFIGKEQARLSLLLEKLTARLAKRDAMRAESEQAKSRAESIFRTFKADLARLIAAELNLGRRYIATQLDSDYASIDLKKFRLLTEQERQEKKTLINKVAPSATIDAIEVMPHELMNNLNNAKALCEQSITAAVIAELQQHAAMLKWAKDGLEYHKEHSLETCLFCGNEFSNARLKLLEQSIDDRFALAIAAVEDLISEIEQYDTAIQTLRETLPARSAFDESLAEAYHGLRTALVGSLAELDKLLSMTSTLLDKKAKTPNLSVPANTLDLERARIEVEFAHKLINESNALIVQHNDKIARFEQEKAEAAGALKAHYLVESEAAYRELVEKFKQKENEAELRARLHSRLHVCIERLQRELRAHGLAVEPINKLLEAYLGHGDVTLATLEDGYQIQRRGMPIEGPLSEGEKTALALCYFLSKLGENGRKKSDLIAVIDDPISSLDSRALNYALCLLRVALCDVGQMILLTHNLQFMNEAKKWLKPLARTDKPAKPIAALYFLELRLGADGRRSASIKPLPKLLRDYDSEYHYLFSLILAFVTDEADNAHLGYILPNILRKVLELFLMFKTPGPDGLGSKLTNEYVRDCGIGEARINALYRLVDVESHGDNLDDLVSFSSMTVEEVSDAANALFALMEKLDPHHLNRMKKLCA